MADITRQLFYHSPVPTISVCECQRLIACNPAAAKFLQQEELAEGCDKFVCGTNCLKSFELDGIKITIEGFARTWITVLKAAKDRSVNGNARANSLDTQDQFISFTRTRKADSAQDNEKHDSPVESSFPDHSTHSERGFCRIVMETIRAKMAVSYFVHNNFEHYVITFHDIFVSQHGIKDEYDVARLPVQGWMDRCKSAVFDSMQVLGYVVDAGGDTVYYNKAARKLANGLNSRAIPRETEEMPLWTPDFRRRLTYEEMPGPRICITRKGFRSLQWGQIDPVTKRKCVLRGWGDCLYEPVTGEFLGASFFAEILGFHEELERQNQLARLQSFESICDTMPHFVWTADTKGGGVWFSSQWLEYTGLSLESSRGFGWKKIIHPEDVLKFEKIWQDAHDNITNYEIETRCRRHDGTYRWMLKRGAPIKDSDGTVLLWTGTNTDIHDTVMARKTARHQRSQMVQALRHSQVNIWAMEKGQRTLTMFEGNLDGIDAVNESFLASIDAFVKREGLANEVEVEIDQLISEVMQGQRSRGEMEIKLRNRWHKVTIIPDYGVEDRDTYHGGEVIGAIGCAIDISDQKARSLLELDNKALAEEKHLAKEQSRMKSVFLANMSHEIRTPVAGVIGLANLLLDSELDDDQREHAQAIQMSAQTLLMIVNDILDFSKVESGKLTLENIDFNLATLVTNLWKVMQYSAKQKSIDFTAQLDFHPDLCVYGDPGRIRQILTNLLSNAIKFTRHGHVKLRAAAVPDRRGIRITFTVEDTGIGIKKDVLTNLFRPFQQGDSSTARLFGGSGLGLSISRSLAVLMKGQIELESNQDVGTTATFSLTLRATAADFDPRALESPILLNERNGVRSLVAKQRLSPCDSPRRPSLANRRTKSCNDSRRNSLVAEETNNRDALRIRFPLADRSKTHILLAEDNPVNRLIAVRAIERLGFTVSAVWNGQEALDYLIADRDASHREVDLVLMDCQMPVMDGYTATYHLRKDDIFAARGLADLPIVAMTASAIQGDREKCFDAGMSDYLSKPVDVACLEGMLVKWLAKKMTGPREEDENYE